MKVCTRCKSEKPTTDYYVKDSKSGRLHTQCKACYKIHRKSYSAEHYTKYRNDYLLRGKLRRERIRQEFRKNMLDYLSDKSCILCGECDIRVLEFDHLEPNSKKFGISQGARLGYKWDDILVEIKKCRILCANCHKKHTAQQFGWYKSINGGTERI